MDGAYIASVCLVWYITTIMRVCGARARIYIYLSLSFNHLLILSFTFNVPCNACQVLRCPLWAHRYGISYGRVLGTDGGGESDPRRTAPDVNATGMVGRVDAFLSPLPRVQVRATEEACVCVCVCVYVVKFALVVLFGFFCIGIYIIFSHSLQ